MSKIIINGSEPDDIKLNGVTPDKIMLNGQCYFEKAPEPDPHNYLYKWDFTKSLVDEKQDVEADLRGYGQSWATRDSSGVHITGQKQFLSLGNEQISLIGKTIEIDISEFDFQGDTSLNTIILSYDGKFMARDDNPNYLFFYSTTDGNSFSMRSYKQQSVNYDNWKVTKVINDELSRDAIDGKTIKCIFNSDGTNYFYLNDVLIGSTSECWANNANTAHNNLYIKIGSSDKANDGYDGNSYNMTITGVRIYENEE